MTFPECADDPCRRLKITSQKGPKMCVDNHVQKPRLTIMERTRKLIPEADTFAAGDTLGFL